MNLQLTQIWQEITDQFNSIFQAIVNWIELNGTELIGALLVILIAYVIGSLLAALVSRSFRSRNDSQTLSDFLSLISKAVILVIGIVIAIQVLNFTNLGGSLLAGVGIITFALGFAIQDLVKDVLAGLFIIIKQPFSDGHLISGDNFFGQVIRTDMRSTRLKTIDGHIVTIPNKNLFNASVENFTLSKSRRLAIMISVTTDKTSNEIKRSLAAATSGSEIVNITAEGKGLEFVLLANSSTEMTLQLFLWLRKTSESYYRQAFDQVVETLSEYCRNTDEITEFEIGGELLNNKKTDSAKK